VEKLWIIVYTINKEYQMKTLREAKSLFFVLFCVACAENSMMVPEMSGGVSLQEIRQRTVQSRKVTTEEQRLVFSNDSTLPKQSPEETRSTQVSTPDFPDGQHFALRLGETYLVAPCRNIDVSINQVLVPGGDLGTVATITCRERTGTVKKAEFACAGTQLDFKYENSPYQLICQ
jgi:hypothetical protein